MIDLFHFSNIYVYSDEALSRLKDNSFIEKLIDYSLNDQQNNLHFSYPSRYDIYNILTSFNYSTTVQDIVFSDKFQPFRYSICIRRFVIFLVLHGVFRRVHYYPILLTDHEQDIIQFNTTTKTMEVDSIQHPSNSNQSFTAPYSNTNGNPMSLNSTTNMFSFPQSFYPQSSTVHSNTPLDSSHLSSCTPQMNVLHSKTNHYEDHLMTKVLSADNIFSRYSKQLYHNSNIGSNNSIDSQMTSTNTTINNNPFKYPFLNGQTSSYVDSTNSNPIHHNNSNNFSTTLKSSNNEYVTCQTLFGFTSKLNEVPSSSTTVNLSSKQSQIRALIKEKHSLEYISLELHIHFDALLTWIEKEKWCGILKI